MPSESLHSSETSSHAPARHIVAVASGKGGVGKSTVSVSLATALAGRGALVGLLDADIYGPNIPQMMGARNRLEKSPSGKIQPIVQHGVRLVSVGFVTDEATAIIYRGPLVGKMVKRFLDDVEWGSLDYLIIDLPPGTGDASLTLAQSVALTGVVIVTTPQSVALSDARKSLVMFQRLRVPTLGIVENMSYYTAPGSETPVHIFGKGGGEALSKEYDAPFLGAIPLDPVICAGGDAGAPLPVFSPDSQLSRIIRSITDRLMLRIEEEEARPEPDWRVERKEP
jgi:ATP-binding protein involved in chromosome partitioning